MVLLKSLSILSGKFANNNFSKHLIPLFEKAYQVDKKKFKVPKKGFNNLNEWFKRDFKKYNLSNKGLFSPCESFLYVQNNINSKSIIFAKNKSYSLDDLIGEELSKEFNNGTLMHFRLTPGHYHNFHHIGSGKILSKKTISGTYYPVNNLTKLFTSKMYENKRDITIIQTKEYGKIIYSEIGALNVGSIVQLNKEKDLVKRGEKKGYFQFGGSTVLIFFQKDKVKINSKYLNKKEQYVDFGTIIDD